MFQFALGLPYLAIEIDHHVFTCHYVRRGKEEPSAIDDVIDIAAHRPWQVGVILAFMAYLVLHHFATRAFDPSGRHPQGGR